MRVMKRRNKLKPQWRGTEKMERISEVVKAKKKMKQKNMDIEKNSGEKPIMKPREA